MYLAQIDENDLCVGLKQVNEFIDDGFHIEVESLNQDYLYRIYKDGEWLKEKHFPEQEESEVVVSLEDKINYLYYKERGLLG